jgi:SOS-response transcriptional repressor LexA
MRLSRFPGNRRLSPFLPRAVKPLHLQMERIGNTLRLVESQVDLSDMARRDAKRSRNAAVQPVIFAILSHGATTSVIRDNLELQNLSLVEMDKSYSERRLDVNKKVPIGEKNLMRAQIGKRMQETRSRLGLTQEQMAQYFSVQTAAYGKWETGMNFPRGTVFATLARLAPDDEKPFWLQLAGLQPEQRPKEDELRTIPFFQDALAAGIPREVSDCEMRAPLVLPRAWLPGPGNLVAVCVRGDSMAPIVLDGYIVVIDTLQRAPERLAGRMVAAREGDGVTIKWLRKDGDTFFLEAQNISRRHQVRVLRSDGDFSIIGAVVKLIGDVPKLGVG